MHLSGTKRKTIKKMSITKSNQVRQVLMQKKEQTLKNLPQKVKGQSLKELTRVGDRKPKRAKRTNQLNNPPLQVKRHWTETRRKQTE